MSSREIPRSGDATEPEADHGAGMPIALTSRLERDAVALIRRLNVTIQATPTHTPGRESAIICAEDADSCVDRGAYYHARVRAERGLTYLLGFNAEAVITDALACDACGGQHPEAPADCPAC